MSRIVSASFEEEKQTFKLQTDENETRYVVLTEVVSPGIPPIVTCKCRKHHPIGKHQHMDMPIGTWHCNRCDRLIATVLPGK